MASIKTSTTDSLSEIILWLNIVVKQANTVIRDSQESGNYGRELHFIAKKEAYEEMLKRLSL